jgi:hypothetical protein
MQSTSLRISKIRLFATLATGLALTGCAVEAPARRLHGGYRLMQKQQYQALYGPDGRILRLLVDRDRDGRAEAVVVYRRNGRPERGEIDTDGDGAVDRWEQLRADGSLERVDLDTDRDGRVDRTDYPQ